MVRLRVERTPRATKLDFEPGQYFLYLVLYAERPKPMEQWLRVDWNGKFDEFMMEKCGPPRSAEREAN